MAYIDLPEKKKKKSGRKRLDIAKAYAQYRPVRMAYLAKNPLCQDCIDPNIVNENGKTETRIKRGEEVHHIKPLTTAKDESQMFKLATDMDNLKTLCHWHHLYEHGKVIDPRFI
jgi:hypothetical protein